jgi:hypothetical protein
MVAALVAVSAAGCGGGDGGQSGQPLEQATVSGTVTYDRVPTLLQGTGTSQTGRLDFANATPRPVRGAVVQVRQGNAVLASTTTDDAGHYSLTFQAMSNGGSLEVAALAMTLTPLTLAPLIQVDDNTSQGNPVWAIGASVAATGGTVNLHATHGWNTATSTYDPAKRKAAFFAILDSMTTATRAVLAAPHAATLPDLTLPALKVNWSPGNVPGTLPNGQLDPGQGLIGTSHFNSGTKKIYILGKAPVGVPTSGVDSDEFDDHVIVHEWGHFLEDAISRSDSPGGQHGAGDVLDPRLSWSEGYGDAIPAMLLGDTLYVDTGWRGTNQTAFGFDAETGEATDDPITLNSQPLRGPFSEFTVMRLLYDLFDPPSGAEGFDGVELGIGPILDVMRGPQKTTDALVTLGSFVSGLRGHPGLPDTTLDALLDHYTVGHITDAFGAGDARLAGMYHPVSLPLPFTASPAPTLSGTAEFNTAVQNSFYVFTSTTSRSVTVSATSVGDVGISVFGEGRGFIAGADVLFENGTESFSFPAQTGKTYVVVLTGFPLSANPPPATFTSTLSIQ